jgi:ribosomal protein S18 acetylase RimI-like enzyme
MKASIHVRAARIEDTGFLVDAQLAMARETEDKELDRKLVLAGVRAVFADERKGRYLVSELEGHQGPVGCLLLTLEWSEWRNGWFWWIQSVFTDTRARGRGVYRALWDEVRRQAGEREDVRGIRLYVEEGNEAARRVYERLGMQATSYRFYELDFSSCESRS